MPDKNIKNNYDLIIIGGGFYGCLLGLFLKQFTNNILIIEKNDRILSEASYYNQARIHNGYHYPRSHITAMRSHINFQQFCLDFKSAVVQTRSMMYAIAKYNSKVSANQFITFCSKIGMPLKSPPTNFIKLFSPELIHSVFLVDEPVFDAALLRKIISTRLKKNQIKVETSRLVKKITKRSSQIDIHLDSGEILIAKKVVNCTYAGINDLLKNSSLPLLPLKFELTEMPVITLPKELQEASITIMDGPFFSVMPFPDEKKHTLHHVRYTPHFSWQGKTDIDINYQQLKSNYPFMIKDAARYIPLLQRTIYNSSFYQIKTILISNEKNDGRPILFQKDYTIKNHHVVLGGKLDNVYDILEKFSTQGL
jgi:glycine/D-amino acid oxidase-like deaminating enzyme